MRYCVLILAMLSLTGCISALTGTSDPASQIMLIKETNAQGCFLLRANGRMAAGEVTTIMIGTVGATNLSQSDCVRLMSVPAVGQ